MLRMRFLLVFAALGLAVGLTACGDEPAARPPGDDVEEDAGPDVGPDVNPDIGPTPRARLVLITEPEPTVTYSTSVPMRVRYLNPFDTPIPDAYVSFEIQGDSAGSNLTARNALTDEEGVAETDIVGGQETVDFTVEISVADDTVDPLSVLVHVKPKGSSDYIIRVNYDGPLTLHEVEVLLYDTDRACDTLIEGDEPSEDVAWTSLILRPDAEGEIPDRGFDAPSNVTFHYAAALGEPSDGSGGGLDYVATFGCQDEIGTPEPGSGTLIEIDMHNLWPAVAGTYRIQTVMEVLDIAIAAAGPDVGPILDAIFTFLTDPGEGILRIAALAVAGDDYYLESPWDLLFECDEPLDDVTGLCEGEVVLTTPWGTVAATVVESLVDLGLSAIPGQAGETIRDIFQGADDVITNAREFQMAGNLVIENDPAADGTLGDDNSIVFNQITWLWSGNERTIELRNEAFLRGNNIEAAVVFHPDERYADVYSLQLDPFNVDLNYGEMLIWILEGVVFPQLIGPEVQSFEDLFTRLIDCEDLGDRLACEGDYAGDPDCDDSAALAAGAAEAACEALQETAVTALEAWLSSLTVDLGTWYHMGTPVDDPCKMGFPPGSSQFSVQTLGGSADVDQCDWDAEVRFESGDDPEPVGGTFWGEKL